VIGEDFSVGVGVWCESSEFANSLRALRRVLRSGPEWREFEWLQWSLCFGEGSSRIVEAMRVSGECVKRMEEELL
jgi:hypothetical protein